MKLAFPVTDYWSKYAHIPLSITETIDQDRSAFIANEISRLLLKFCGEIDRTPVIDDVTYQPKIIAMFRTEKAAMNFTLELNEFMKQNFEPFVVVENDDRN